MRHRNPIAVLVLSIALAGRALAAADVPADDVAGVAKAIEDNYYDAALGKKIADTLRADAASHRFDAIHDDRDLANVLTDRLKAFDQHFVVHWSADAPAGPGPQGGPPPSAGPGPGPGGSGPGPGPQGGPPPVDTDRLTNYGIRRVEVQPGNVGYIDLRRFADFDFEQPDQPARQAIEAALQLVAGTDALIIDLRDDGGGSPAMVGYLGSAFVRKGADVFNTFRLRDRSISEAPSQWYPKPRLDVPLYILTSARTGSAAESFAYTLKNAHRATIVGEATAGAANPGGDVDAGHGFSVFVSVGSPVSPITKGNWEGAGVQPDVAATPAAAMQVAKALALQEVIRKTPADAAVDARWALEALRAEQAKPAPLATADYAGHFDVFVISNQDGGLSLKRERRPSMMLTALGGDLFTVQGESSRRVRFERDAAHRVIALEWMTSDGQSTRYSRDGK